jgi:hypothetical protein
VAFPENCIDPATLIKECYARWNRRATASQEPIGYLVRGFDGGPFFAEDREQYDRQGHAVVPVYAAPVPPVVGEDAVERVAKAIYEADDPWHTAFPWPNLNEKQGGAEGYRNAARAAISAASIPAVVKELDWFSPSNGRDTLERVETCLGVHRVWTHHEANGRWFWSLDGYEKASGEAATKDEAKAAAQADYERRILSCLSHPAQGWREMDSAPKDGTEILVCGPANNGGTYRDVQRWPENWCGKWPVTYMAYAAGEPTHWVPLPAAPAAAGGSDNG